MSFFIFIVILLGVATLIAFFMAFTAGAGLPYRDDLESDHVRIICPDCLAISEIPLDDQSFTCRCGSRLILDPDD